MNTRISNLPQHKLATTLKDLRIDADALKAGQRTSAMSGVLGYETVTNNTWDDTATIGADSDSTNRQTILRVTWTGDGSQDIAFAAMAIDLYVNGTDSAHQLSPVNSSWTDGTRTASVSYNGMTVSHHTYIYEMNLTTLKAVTYYLKAYIYGSCLGTIGISH